MTWVSPVIDIFQEVDEQWKLITEEKTVPNSTVQIHAGALVLLLSLQDKKKIYTKMRLSLDFLIFLP